MQSECICKCRRIILVGVTESAVSVVAQLRKLGYRITPQREAIVEEIMRAEGHLTAQGLTKDVQRRLPAVNASTIYRTLELLEGLDVVRHSHQEQGAAYHRVGEEDHVHLSCVGCGEEDDLPMELAEQLRELVVRHHGFRPDLTHFAISGLCVSCQESAPGPQEGDR